MSRRFVLPARSEAGKLFKQLWRAAAQTTLDFLFPPHCIACARIGSLYCPHCLAELPFPPINHTPSSPLTLHIAAAFFEGALRDAIHALKYEGKQRYAPLLAVRLALALAQTDYRADAVIALPLHAERLAWRGYNQSALLAQALAAHLKLPYLPDAAQRIQNTVPQVGLNRQQRAANVANAFQAAPDHVRGLHILLVDDVATTGATLGACAAALKNAGAASVCGLTVATAIYHQAALDLPQP
jgi:ComF family protein